MSESAKWTRACFILGIIYGLIGVGQTIASGRRQTNQGAEIGKLRGELDVCKAHFKDAMTVAIMLTKKLPGVDPAIIRRLESGNQ